MQSAYLSDAFSFDPRTDQWKKLSDIVLGDSTPISIAGACAVTPGVNQVLVFGGDDGETAFACEVLHRKIQELDNSGNRSEAAALRNKLTATLDNHRGFSRKVLAYNVLTDSWTCVGEFPEPGPVTTTAVAWDGGVVIPTGEIRPGVRTPQLWKIVSKRKLLHR